MASSGHGACIRRAASRDAWKHGHIFSARVRPSHVPVGAFTRIGELQVSRWRLSHFSVLPSEHRRRPLGA
jgi:hypothetical protein